MCFCLCLHLHQNISKVGKHVLLYFILTDLNIHMYIDVRLDIDRDIETILFGGLFK